MSDVRTPEGLLEIAIDALRREILPALEGDRRFTGLMIANAMSIAQRQCSTAAVGENPAVTELRHDIERQLRGSAQASGGEPATEAPAMPSDAASLAALSREIVDTIRAGLADPGQSLHEPLRAWLTDSARAEVEVSNPRYLARD